MNRTSHMWNVTVDWSYRDEVAYDSKCYDTHVTLPCGTTDSQKVTDASSVAHSAIPCIYLVG